MPGSDGGSRRVSTSSRLAAGPRTQGKDGSPSTDGPAVRAELPRVKSFWLDCYRVEVRGEDIFVDTDNPC